MIHTSYEILNLILESVKVDQPICCLEQAMIDWIKLTKSNEHKEFFDRLTANMLAEEEDDEELCKKILLLGLTVGSVCAIRMLTMIARIELGTFMKKGPEEPV